MLSLRELEARFISYSQESADEMFKRGVSVPSYILSHVDSFSGADGISFLCPKSFAQNHGNQGTHRIQVYFVGSSVPSHLGRNKNGETVRWKANGSSLDDLSLTPSIQEEDPTCGWHGFVGSNGVPPGSAQ